MNLPICHNCGHDFTENESAWADDVTVIDTSGETATTRLETRYVCDDCAEA